MENIERPPSEILNIASNSTTKEARRGYKTLVRTYDPEHHPKEFEKINKAYRTITGEQPMSNEAYPLYAFPLTFLEQKIKDKTNENTEQNLLPLSVIPASIFNVDFELEKIIK